MGGKSRCQTEWPFLMFSKLSMRFFALRISEDKIIKKTLKCRISLQSLGPIYGLG